MKRNIKNEALKITGGEFKSWYQTLTNTQRKEYHYLLSNSERPKETIIKKALG